MSAPVFLIDPKIAIDANPGSVVELDGPEGRHAATVQRLRAGEVIALVDGNGRRITGSITETTKDSCAVVIHNINDEPEPRPRITAVQAIAKGDRGELAVQMLTEAGIDVIIPWQAENSVAKWDGERGAKHHTKWQATAREAAKQARRAHFPIVESPVTTAAVADLVTNAGVALVLDEESATPLTSIDYSTAHDVLLVIGPEGGLSPNERALFADAGADLVRLGTTVLRTSTAGVAALGVVMARVGRW
jgi:16S rRNA (uracil1498-N3)-methyltransferase